MTAQEFDSSVPSLKLTPFLCPERKLSTESKIELASELVARLTNPPYWLVLVTEQDPIDQEMLHQVFEEMARDDESASTEPHSISWTRVRVNPQEAAREGNVTRYSRTPDALPLHTDCSNKTQPANLVAFAMERPDSQGGGESLMLSIEDLIRDLPKDLIDLLHQTQFLFSQQHCFAILQSENEKYLIRYYRNQIESTLHKTQQQLPIQVSRALDEVDRCLANSNRIVRFHMRPGDVVMMDNHRVLHGRGGMRVDSERVMHRFRMLVPSMLATRSKMQSGC